MARRWIDRKQQHGESPEVDAFLAEVEEVCRRHGLSISHQDIGGAFVVKEHNEHDAAWLSHASDDREGR